MRLHAITLRNVRRFVAPVRVDGIGPGVNVLSAPNEHGKSTVFDALHAVFFYSHTATAKPIKALRPHAGGAPEITVEIETDEGRFTIAKRWLARASATVHRGDLLIAQADAAEAWVSDLLGPAGAGPSGLLWVSQGLTDLEDPGWKPAERSAQASARRDLLSSVTGEVEAMTGGRRMDAARAACRAELASYQTDGGKPRTGGALKEALDEVAALTAAEQEHAATAEVLHGALHERRGKRRELAALDDPEAAAHRAAQLRQAEADLAAAQRHAAEVDKALQNVELARLAAGRAREQADDFVARHAETAQAAQAQSNASDALGAAAAAATAAEAALAAAGARFDQARQAQASGEADLRQARNAQAAREGQARRSELADRLKRAEAARDRMEQAAGSADLGPDAAALRKVADLSGEVLAARLLHDSAAVQVTIDYDPAQEGRVRVDGAPLHPGMPRAVPGKTVFDLIGLGRLSIDPGAGRQGDGAALARAETALQTALAALGAETLAEAEAAGDARAAATRERDTARAELDALAPHGMAALQAQLAAIPDLQDDDSPDTQDPPTQNPPPQDMAAAEATLSAARAHYLEALATRDAAQQAQAQARTALAGAQVAAAAADARAARAEAAAARLGDRDLPTLHAAADQASQALELAEAALSGLRKTAPDMPVVEAAHRRAASVVAEAQATRARLIPDLARLDERISRAAGDAVEQTLAETREQLDAAQANLARVEFEVATLNRLAAALDAARATARDRYFAPVAAELRPLMAMLWSDANLSWGDDTLLPESLTRGGVSEQMEVLSGGTREQIALMVRLAFARMLARSGRPAPLILDDALVFTDDDRIEAMFNALHAQATDLQIIVLSCRQRAFRNLGGTTLRLEALPED